MFFFGVYQFFERVGLRLRFLPSSLLNLTGRLFDLPDLVRESEIMAENIAMDLMNGLDCVKAEYLKKTGKHWNGGGSQ